MGHFNWESITRVCLSTLTEKTGGAPLLALFEKWPPELAPNSFPLDVKRLTEYNQVRDQVVPLRGNRATSPPAAEPPLSGDRAHREAQASAIG